MWKAFQVTAVLPEDPRQSSKRDRLSLPCGIRQVKSCILLAGLYADSVTSVTEPYVSRDHSERMLSSFGAALKTDGSTVSIQPEPRLMGQEVAVPGDISSAAYFIAAAF